MGKYDKLLSRILIGQSDTDIPFVALCTLLEQLGFDRRVKGSHNIFTKHGVNEIINVQPKNNKAKPYQVKQVRNMIIRYKLGGMDDV